MIAVLMALTEQQVNLVSQASLASRENLAHEELTVPRAIKAIKGTLG